MTPTSVVRPSHEIRSGIEVCRDHLTIGVLSADGTALLRLEGELDAATAPALLEVGRSLVGAGSSAVVVDCAHLRFCDSAGLHAFVSIRGTAGVDSLTLVRTTPTVRRLLALAGLDDLLGATP